MPFPLNATKYGALLAAVDARDMMGLNVFDRGSSVTLNGSTMLYPDLLHMLMGYGSQTGRTIAEDFRDQWDLFQPGVQVRSGVDADDNLYIEVEAASGGPWTLTSAGENSVFGMPAASTAAVLTGGWYRVTATRQRSYEQPVNKHLQMTATILGTPRTFDIPSVPYKAQSVLTLFRKVGSVGGPDDDYGLISVEQLDNTANDPGGGGRRIRWGVNAEGDVWTAVPTAAGIAAPTFTVAGEPFRQLVGADADGSVSSEVIPGDFGSVTVTTYQRFGEPVLTFSRPIRLRETYGEDTHAFDGRDHGIAFGRSIPKRGIRVLGYLDGPGDARPRHRHLTRHFLPRAHVGQLVTVCNGWPCELRRAIDPRDATAAYDLNYTTDGHADIGRIVCRRDTEDAQDRSLNWTDGRRARGMFEMRLKEAESGV